MKIAITGATGFLGRHIVAALTENKHDLRCWHRPSSDRSGFEAVDKRVEWVVGDLGDERAGQKLVAGCDAVVHAALDHPVGGFRGGEGNIVSFVERNVVGTLKLIEAARTAGVARFVFISTCAVHEKILDGRPLDETHPLWPTSHYGAHKAAIEKFVHSYGYGLGYPICALRPTGIYGLAHPAEDSKWFDLVQTVAKGETVHCRRGGKEVHAADVAKAAGILLTAPAEQIRGGAFNCYDMYISEWDVAHLAKEIAGSGAAIQGSQTTPKNQIRTDKLRGLGMEFGGRELLRETIKQLVDAASMISGR
jgi:nucleoside-diphosphate-sugar epimerase